VVIGVGVEVRVAKQPEANRRGKTVHRTSSVYLDLIVWTVIGLYTKAKDNRMIQKEKWPDSCTGQGNHHLIHDIYS
jgi:hypothetical protein